MSYPPEWPWCPECEQPDQKVLVYGLPAALCLQHDPPVMHGFWSRVIGWLPFNGSLVVYEGSYWRALWDWLRGR